MVKKKQDLTFGDPLGVLGGGLDTKFIWKTKKKTNEINCRRRRLLGVRVDWFTTSAFWYISVTPKELVLGFGNFPRSGTCGRGGTGIGAISICTLRNLRGIYPTFSLSNVHAKYQFSSPRCNKATRSYSYRNKI